MNILNKKKISSFQWLLKGVFLRHVVFKRNKSHVIYCYVHEFCFIIKMRVYYYVLKIISVRVWLEPDHYGGNKCARFANVVKE